MKKMKKKFKAGMIADQTYPRGDKPAAAPTASRWVISWSKVWPAVSKSANLCPGLHQLGGSRRPGSCL